MMRTVWAIFLAVFLTVLLIFPATVSKAQEQAWVQVETLPSRASAELAIRRYAGNLQDVNGFTISNGRYAVALGPYSPSDARQVLAVYKAERLIPQDSFIANSATYQQQFWPKGAHNLRRPTLEPPTTTSQTEPGTSAPTEPEITPQAEPDETAEAATNPAPKISPESKREALTSEKLLSKDQRKQLQIALKWAGFYDGAIDGAYGRGTRGAMSRWQEQNFFDQTGVLSTMQRAELMRQYNAVFEGLGLELVRDTGAGISMVMPTTLVKFAKYEPPFAQYNAVGDGPARLLLISQQGDEATLAGLYDIMQTLEIVPQDGPREMKGKSFTLVGENAKIVSHTQAWQKNGEIKGFTLIWPANDEARRQRVLARMLASFERTDGVLDPAAGANEDQRIDLMAGLEIRQPKRSRSGFYVDQSGAVVTSADILDNCGRITIDDDYAAEVVARDKALGIVVLRAKEELAPVSVAIFQQSVPRLQSDIAVAGYSYGGILGAPTMTYGQLADLRGLNGEPGLKRLALAALEGDVGGPVVDASGAVLGMLLPASQNARQLPDGVSFAVGSEALTRVLQQAGITYDETSDQTHIPPETLTRQASDMTVLVSCWE